MENCVNGKQRSKMNFKSGLQHIGLLFILMAYTGFGGMVFRHLEFPTEALMLNYINSTLRTRRSYFVAAVTNSSLLKLQGEDFVSSELEVYEIMFMKAITAGYSVLMNDENPSEKWTYLKAVFFSSTVITTIGYGDIVPVTTEGRIFCIVYALIGIPLTLTVIADWGRLFASSFSTLIRHTPSLHSNISKNFSAARRTSYVLLAVCFLFVYLSIGAALFVIWEDWTFTEGFYFCFITMTTIGFGDLVPKKPKYMLVCTVYILVGLALTSTIIELVRRQYAKSWQQLQALRGPLAQNFKKFAENAPGLDVVAFQQDLMKVLTVVTMPKRNARSTQQNWDQNWGNAFDLVMGDLAQTTSMKQHSSIIQIVIYESSV